MPKQNHTKKSKIILILTFISVVGLLVIGAVGELLQTLFSKLKAMQPKQKSEEASEFKTAHNGIVD